MKNFKKKLIIFFAIIFFIALAILIQRLIFHKIDEENPEVIPNENISAENETENTTEENNTEAPTSTDTTKELVVATMEDEIGKDSLYCGTFQIVWNELLEKNGKDIVFNPVEKVAENLNKKEFLKTDVNEKDYYVKSGYPTEKLRDLIKKEIKEKFDEKSDILDKFTWEKNETDAKGKYFFYTMLKKVFNFKYEFKDLEDGNFEGDTYKNIKYFGTDGTSDEQVKDQIKILYYNNDEDFAVELSTKEGENIILCNNPEGKNFKEIYNNINTKQEKYTGIRILEDIDDFKMPNLKFDELREYTELENREFTDSKNNVLFIEKALQTVKLELNKKGGKLVSEAAIMTKESAAIIDTEIKPKHLYLDDSFVMFLVEEGKDKPYFATSISDITKFQK